MPDGRHGALPPALPHTIISQHAAQQVYVLKTRDYYCFYFVFISYFKAQHIVDAPYLSVCGLRGAESIIFSVGGTETILLSAGGAESMDGNSNSGQWLATIPSEGSIQ